MAAPKIILSPLSGRFTEGTITVDVQIHRLEDTGWCLEVIDSEGTSIVWEEEFSTDAAAQAEFQRCVAEEGLAGITTDTEPTRH